MMHHTGKPRQIVTTRKEHCRVCYTCVRECPAKAIRIVDGQAEILPDRCISCGNCVRVCSQNAKQPISGVDSVRALLSGTIPVAACLAPSFPADFPDMDYRVLVGKLRSIGFQRVVEVSFGADLVADRYRELMASRDGHRYIATSCPAVVAFVERYHPENVSHLVPIVSPMIAAARILHADHGSQLKVVFIGPCIAKKMEAMAAEVVDEIDEVLTFRELKELFDSTADTHEAAVPSDFDPPHPGLGSLFPLTRGILQAADIREDLVAGDVVSADGLSEFTTAIAEFASGNLDARLLEVLSCRGCIMGPGMSTSEPKFRRRSRVSHYVRFKGYGTDPQQHSRTVDRYAALNLSRTYQAFDQRIPAPSEADIRVIYERFGKTSSADELNCRACGYHTCREHAIAIHKGLAEDEMCLPYVIDRLKQTIHQLSVSSAQLATTQDQLMQSEKLASMGQLAAGVAHELNNPLGVVLMYSHLLIDEIHPDSTLYADLKMIANQAQRGKKIVSNLLDFARENKVLIEEVDLRELLETVTGNISRSDNIDVVFQFGHRHQRYDMDPDQMAQVFGNIITNAFSAMHDGGTLTIATTDSDAEFHVAFSDTGIGIPSENIGKVFTPFFTTKKIGKGTGLGLAVSYGIVKMHRGRIDVRSSTGSDGPAGTVFTVSLPRQSESV